MTLLWALGVAVGLSSLWTYAAGHVLLYDRHGRIVFSGGITEGRGHSGDNIGKSSVESFLLNGAIPTEKTAVYGCSLVDGTDEKELATW